MDGQLQVCATDRKMARPQGPLGLTPHLHLIEQKIICTEARVLLTHWLETNGYFDSRGPVAMSGDIFACRDWGRDATGIW